MRRLSSITRRGFGQGLGSALALAGSTGHVLAHAGGHEVSVGIDDFAFSASRIEILTGDSVTWENGDVAPHTATADNQAWDTGPLAQGERGRITFADAGEYPYHCTFHPQMKGTILVRSRDGE